MVVNKVPYNPLEGERPELSINLHDGSQEQISIVIVHKDRPEYLNITLQTITICSFNNNYEIIVVDNGSGKESQDFLDDVEKNGIKVLRNPTNLFWSAAANRGAAEANPNSKYIVFMHCDIAVLNPAWIDILINVAQGQNAGMVGVDMQSYYLQEKKVDFINDYLILFTRECWNALGGWPDKLPQIGHSFIMTMRATNKKFNPQVIKSPIVHHYRCFALNVNEYERITEAAMATIPSMIRDVYSQSVGKV